MLIQWFKDADLLPFDFRSLYTTIEKYDKEVVELTNKMRENTPRRLHGVHQLALRLCDVMGAV